MINYKIILLVVVGLTLTIYSCSTKKNEGKKDANVTSDTIVVNKDFRIIYRLKDGIKYSLNIKDGDKEKSIGFFKNGNLNTITEYYKNKGTKIEEYYNTPEACLKMQNNYLYNELNKDHIALNRLFYDSCGSLNLSKSIFTEVISDKDTLNLGEKKVIIIKDHRGSLRNNIVKTETKFFEGGFDNYFNIVDKQAMKVFDVKKNKIELTIEGKKVGPNNIKGVFVEKAYLSNGYIQINPTYVNYEYFVKKDKILSNSEEAYYSFFNNFFFK